VKYVAVRGLIIAVNKDRMGSSGTRAL